MFSSSRSFPPRSRSPQWIDNDRICTRRTFLLQSSFGVLVLGSGVLSSCDRPSSLRDQANSSHGLQRVTLGTDWYAQPEHGGFYQAIATGLYAQSGLEVTIRMGGAQNPNGTQLLLGGAIDFLMGSAVDALMAIAQGVPKVTVAAFFQRDPQCLLAHPSSGVTSLAELAGHPIYISPGARVTYWPYLKKHLGFTDDQVRAYNFNLAPFLLNNRAAQQGYITSEPWAIAQQGGFEPLVFPLAEVGYNPYSATLETTVARVRNDPDLVQRFVTASIQGWHSYLDNPEPGNQLIQKDNPEMSPEQIAFGVAKLKEYAIVTGEDGSGIGRMTHERWRSLYEQLVETEQITSGLDYQAAYTLDFL